jgi:hypothetical protein
MWRSNVEPERPWMPVWCICISCWIYMATNTHSEYVIFIVFPLQQWLHEHALILCYMYIACLVLNCIYVYIAVLKFKPSEPHCQNLRSDIAALFLSSLLVIKSVQTGVNTKVVEPVGNHTNPQTCSCTLYSK